VNQEKTFYLFNQAVIMQDVRKGVISHRCPACGILNKGTAGFGHFGTAYADKFQIISCLL
jgi:hypothetical protein